MVSLKAFDNGKTIYSYAIIPPKQLHPEEMVLETFRPFMEKDYYSEASERMCIVYYYPDTPTIKVEYADRERRCTDDDWLRFKEDHRPFITHDEVLDFVSERL